jgi:hypothetical protein
VTRDEAIDDLLALLAKLLVDDHLATPKPTAPNSVIKATQPEDRCEKRRRSV